MKYITILTLLTTTLVVTSFNSYAGDHRRHNGISINLGSFYNGLSINYNAPIRHREHRVNRHNQRHYFNRIANKATRHFNRYSAPHNNVFRHRKQGAQHYFHPRQHHPIQRERQIAFHNKQLRQPARRACHPIRKTVINRHNRYKEVGGTMCYDRAGQGYIVSGSRYRIR